MIVMRTSKGDIKIKLDTENTPKTAANFLAYVEQGFYNGTLFHRVIDNFMIQGGGFDESFKQKSTNEPIINEAKNAMPNNRGTIAMARTMDPHSASAQFFINVVNNSFLNFSSETTQGYGYCAFGEVVEGMDVADAIAKVRTASKNGHGDVPVEDVVLHEIVVED